MTLPWFPPGSPEHRWMVEQVDRIVTEWETERDGMRWKPDRGPDANDLDNED